jgi:hypothetical protein
MRSLMYKQALQMLEKAAQMFKSPLYEVERQQDGHTTILQPAGWTFDTAIRLQRHGFSLAEQACGHKDDELRAIEALIDSGLIPASVEDAFVEGVNEFLRHITEAIANVSGNPNDF